MKIQQLVEEKAPDLSHLITDDIKELGELFKSHGEEIRIVGGAVRDALLGKKPKDIDLATTATPEKMLEIAEEENIKVIETGIQHGTVTFVIDGEPYEITTLRVDVETDGRHAKVDWTKSFKEDARRRDLTYNAMSVDMEGNLHDYFGGLKDLRANRTDFVGSSDERIQEDYLRILRYFRFLAKHPNQEPNQKILQSIKKNVNGLGNISGERIWIEISKMVTYPNMNTSLKYMCSVGIGEMLFMNSCNQGSIAKSKELVNQTENPITIITPLFNDVLSFTKFASKLKIPNEYRNLGIFLQQEKNKPKESYEEDIVINNLDPSYAIELSKVINSKQLYESTRKAMNRPPFPVSGNDLIQKGMKSGPQLGKTLNMLKKEWINSDYKLNKAELLNKIVG